MSEHAQTNDRRARVGIEKLRAYPGALSLDLELLGRARGAAPGYAWDTLAGRTRSLNPGWEDPVTMAVNAAKPMLTAEDLAAIELVIVGTESSPDQGKPLSTFVARYLGVQRNCRNFECKHACYGGTSAVMMAAHWVASGVAPGKKALVLCTDESRRNLRVEWEYVMGACAVALLISACPDVLELELESNGYVSEEVGDTFRPTSRDEAGNTEQSLYSYMDALDGAYQHFQRKNPGLDYERDFAAHIYHLPFSGMARRAHRAVQKLNGQAARDPHSYDRKVEPSTRYASLIGGSYTASTSLALMSLLDHSESLRAGDRISVYSYGSGSCGEFYSARIGARAREQVARAGLRELLAARESLSVADYEAVENERAAAVDQRDFRPARDGLQNLYGRTYAGSGRLVSRGVRGFFREYEWS
ncbi:MAG: hydroxymethylglutaryl-CoA synthase family protein [Planctomycetota bacterium]